MLTKVNFFNFWTLKEKQISWSLCFCAKSISVKLSLGGAPEILTSWWRNYTSMLKLPSLTVHFTYLTNKHLSRIFLFHEFSVHLLFNLYQCSTSNIFYYRTDPDASKKLNNCGCDQILIMKLLVRYRYLPSVRSITFRSG